MEGDKKPGALSARIPGGILWAILGGLLLFLGVVFFAPPQTHCRENARQANCKSNLRWLALACHVYADDNDEKLPDRWEQLYPKYADTWESRYPKGADNAKIFSCPAAPSKWHDFETGNITPESSSYVLVPGLKAGDPGGLILAYDKSFENHHKQGRNVAFLDARVEWWPDAREAEFQEKLAKQRAAAAKAKPAADGVKRSE